MTSDDWCFAAIKAVIVAVAAVWLLVVLLWEIRPLHSPRWKTVRMITAGVVGASIGAAFRLDSDWAFETAFGCPPPSGVHNLSAVRHYEGGPGEHSLVLVFLADRSTIDQVVSQRRFASETDAIREWQAAGADWADAWNKFAGMHSFGRSSWNRIRPLRNPVVFQWQEGAFQTALFWDAQSERAVALHWRG